MSQFEQFIQDSNNAASAQELEQLFSKKMQEFGFDQFVYSFLTPHYSLGIAAEHGIVHNYPGDWLAYYQKKQYQFIDPVPKEAFKTGQAFAWDSLMGLNANEQRVMDEAREAKLLNGVGIPLYRPNGEIAGFGLASSDGKIDVTNNMLSLLNLYAHQFHNVYINFIRQPGQIPAIELSDTEREILHWFAEGKSLSEIGDIIDMSRAGVQYYRDRIFVKLGTNHRTSAIIKAIHYGLINPYRIKP